MPRRKLPCLIAALSLLPIGLATGCNRAPAPPPPPPAAVTAGHPVEREVIDWDDYTGRVDAIETVDLRARVSGFILKADFEEGKVVDEGAVLFQIDPAPFQADVDKAVGQVQQATAQSENAAAELVRIEKLRASGGGSEKEYQDARFAKLQTAAAVVSAQANEKSARLNLEWTQVRSPITGRVSRKNVTAGNLITGGTASGTLLTTIVKTAPIYCYMDADERSVLKYQRLAAEKKRVSARESQIPCFLQLSNEEGFPHEGMVDFVDNHVDPNTGTLRARGIFANTDGIMIPGLFARVRIPGSGRYRAVLVPDNAIDTNQNIKFLRVVGKDNVIEFRTVKIGSLFGAFRVIESGIAADELIVTNGIQRAIPGVKVAPNVVPLDLTGLQLTAPGSAATQALPATRLTRATVPAGGATRPATGPAVRPAATGGNAQ